MEGKTKNIFSRAASDPFKFFISSADCKAQTCVAYPRCERTIVKKIVCRMVIAKTLDVVLPTHPKIVLAFAACA